MDMISSFKATILFGWSTLVLLAVVAMWLAVPLAALDAIVAMALAYVAQCLVTTSLVIADKAYGPTVTADDDGMYEALIAQSQRFNRFGLWFWSASVFVGLVAFVALVIAVLR